MYSLLWKKSGHYALYVDDKLLQDGNISYDFKTLEKDRVFGCGASKDSYDPSNPVYNINQTMLNELNRMPKYLDSERRIINEEYVLKRIKAEKMMKNQRY